MFYILSSKNINSQYFIVWKRLKKMKVYANIPTKY